MALILWLIKYNFIIKNWYEKIGRGTASSLAHAELELS